MDCDDFVETHSRRIIDLGLYALWVLDLRAALDARYGAYQWGHDVENTPGKKPVPEFRTFVEEHARDWLRVRKKAGADR